MGSFIFASIIKLAVFINSNNNKPRAKVLTLALKAYKKAVKHGHGDNNYLLTIVDYKLPSTEPRLWVINPKTNKILLHSHVTHGRGSGSIYSTSFSNIARSYKSSLGLFKTGKVYQGKHGLSMRLHGLEKGFNDNAFNRAIVIHGANYISSDFIKKHGRAGRSHGCLALNKTDNKKLIKLVKNGSFIFSYYPSDKWLKQSAFLS